jgi:V8-like Glu-specific endopeptidase
MSVRIIVASGDPVQLSVLEQAAVEIAADLQPSSGQPHPYRAMSVLEIEDIRKGAPDVQAELIIATASLPEVRSSPNLKSFPGLAFVKKLQDGRSPPACILASELAEHRDLVQAMPRCGYLYVGVGTRYVEECVDLARELDFLPTPTRAQPPKAISDKSLAMPKPFAARAPEYSLIEVHLREKASRSTMAVDVTIQGKERVVPDEPLSLKQTQVDKLLKESRRLSENFSKALDSAEKYSEWQSDYRALGQQVYKLLDTSAFNRHFGYATAAAHPREMRLRFNLDPGLSDGLWESICDPGTNQFLMLESTITRRDRSVPDQFAARGDSNVGTLNVLVIASDAAENAVPQGLDGPAWRRYWSAHPLRRQPHFQKEVEQLQRLSDRASARPDSARIHVDVLASNPQGAAGGETEWSLAEEVEQRLKANPQGHDVVHFIGHAVFTPRKPRRVATAKRRRVTPDKGGAEEQGYLIFSGRPKAEAIPITRFAGWLKDSSVELIYLSCCRSTSARAAAEFGRNQMRVAIGFNWDLDDERTADFSQFFYEELLDRKLNVCSAIRAARDRLNRDYHGENPVWASTVLFAQPVKWPDVEGVLRPPDRTPKVPTIPPTPVPPGTQGPANNGQTTMPAPASDPSPIPYPLKMDLVRRLAIVSTRSAVSNTEYFKSLVRQADFREEWKWEGTTGYPGRPDLDALKLVDWAIGMGTNPQDRNPALGTLLLAALRNPLSLENQTFIVGMMVAYDLVRSQSTIGELKSRFQIPEQPAMLAADSTPIQLGPAVRWAEETERLELQSWFAPDPEWLDVQLLMTAAQRARSVCRVEVSTTGAMGTGVLIARNLVLTNYHVLALSLTRPPEVLAQNAPSTILRFGVFTAEAANPAGGQSVSLAAKDPIVAHAAEMDFVLLRTDDSIDAATQVTPFGTLGVTPNKQDTLYVLQHPEGGPMKLALATNGVTWIDPGKITLQYTTKVARGSSGSPCFDSKWNLVALHHAGSKSKGEGILMSTIFERIQAYLK